MVRRTASDSRVATARNVTTIVDGVLRTCQAVAIAAQTRGTRLANAGQRIAHRLAGPAANLGREASRVQVRHVDVEVHLALVACVEAAVESVHVNLERRLGLHIRASCFNKIKQLVEFVWNGHFSLFYFTVKQSVKSKLCVKSRHVQ